MALKDLAFIQDLRPTQHPVTVQLPDGRTTTSTHEGRLPFPLPASATSCHIFPSFNGSLLSIGKMCDAGLHAHFTATDVYITTRAGHQVLHGRRTQDLPLWMFALDNPTGMAPVPTASMSATATALPTTPAMAPVLVPHQAATVTPLPTARDNVAFLHACMGSPSISTLERAVRCAYTRLPGLTTAALHRHPPNSLATAKGHLDRVRQGQHSTKPHSTADPVTDTCPATRQRPTNHIYCSRQHIDLTGKFPVTSDAGAAYVMVFYAEDANYIHAETVPDRSAAALTKAYTKGLAWFKSHRACPSLLLMDNESSSEFLHVCELEGIDVQFCPPGNHRSNRAERAIRTFKNHFIAILTAADPDFPLNAWDHLMAQAELTINLMRGSHVNPLVSAYEQLCGQYDYNAHPLAPPGIKVVAFGRQGLS